MVEQTRPEDTEKHMLLLVLIWFGLVGAFGAWLVEWVLMTLISWLGTLWGYSRETMKCHFHPLWGVLFLYLHISYCWVALRIIQNREKEREREIGYDI